MISTGSFLTETSASNKQSELVKKLTAAWEKKNSKTARAGGASLMALSLAACGGEDNTPFSQADVDAAKAEGIASVDITSDNAAAVTAALTAADGSIYASVDEAVTAGAAGVDITSDNAAVKTAALTAADGTIYTSVDAAMSAAEDRDVTIAVAEAEKAILGDFANATELMESDNAAVAQTAKDSAEAELLAGTEFTSVAQLLSSYAEATAPGTGLSNEPLTSSANTVMGTTSSDSIVGTSATYGTADRIVDASTTDSDTLTITASDDITATPVVVGIETVTFNLDAVTSSNTADTFEVNALNISEANVVANVTKAGSTVTKLSVTNMTSGTELTTALKTVTVDTINNADVTVNTTTTGTTIAAVAAAGVTGAPDTTEAVDKLTINATGSVTLTDSDADEAVVINATGGVTVTNLDAKTKGSANSLEVNAGGDTTISTDNSGTIDATLTAGDIEILDAESTGNITIETKAGNIDITDATESTGTLTLTATGDADDVNDTTNAVADGDINIDDADSVLTAVLTASGEITKAVLTAATSVTATAGEDSALTDITAARTLTLASTDADGVTFDIANTKADALRTITFEGSNDVTLRMDADDFDDSEGNLPSSMTKIAAVDNTTGTSKTVIAFDDNADGATIDLSGLAVDEIQLIGAADLHASDVLTVASGQTIVNKLDQSAADLNITASAVAGNSVTVKVADDKTATTVSTLNGITTTNIGTLNLVMEDVAIGTDTLATGTIDVAASTIVNMSGVTDVTVAAVDGQSFNAGSYTGDITLSATNATTVYTLGEGSDTITNGTATALTLNAGEGTDTLKLADQGDYTALALNLTGVEVLEVVDGTAGGAAVSDLAASFMTGSSYVINGSGAGIADGVIIAAQGVAETIDLAGVSNSILVTVTGSSGADIITTSATTAMTVNAGDGADTVTGGAGGDTLNGGAKADTITGGDGADVISGDGGADTIILTEDNAATDKVVANEDESVVYTSATLAGASAAAGDILNFANGVDTVVGFTAGAGGDVMDGVDAAAAPTTGIGVAYATGFAGDTFFLSGNWNADTKAFTIAADGEGADTMILDAQGHGANALSTFDSMTLLIGVDSDDLLAGNFET